MRRHVLQNKEQKIQSIWYPISLGPAPHHCEPASAPMFSIAFLPSFLPPFLPFILSFFLLFFFIFFSFSFSFTKEFHTLLSEHLQPALINSVEAIKGQLRDLKGRVLCCQDSLLFSEALTAVKKEVSAALRLESRLCVCSIRGWFVAGGLCIYVTVGVVLQH